MYNLKVFQLGRMREAGSFTFNYSIAHCVGVGEKRKKERWKEEKGQTAVLRLKIAQKTHVYTDTDNVAVLLPTWIHTVYIYTNIYT